MSPGATTMLAAPCLPNLRNLSFEIIGDEADELLPDLVPLPEHRPVSLLRASRPSTYP